jgi:CheY-like chemotaxis protein
MSEKYIVIADDDEDDKALFKEAMSAYKEISMDEVDNGAALYEKLTSEGAMPDAVFLDLNMPEMGGRECLQKIRANPALKSLPVIMYSTSSSEKDIEDTFQLGANLYVTKPDTFSELKKLLSAIMRISWPDRLLHHDIKTFVFSTK